MSGGDDGRDGGGAAMSTGESMLYAGSSKAACGLTMEAEWPWAQKTAGRMMKSGRLLP